MACESASARQIARRFGLAASTVRAIDKRYLDRRAQSRNKPLLRQMGMDEICLGQSQKFLTVVSNLETGEPLWFGRERKRRGMRSSGVQSAAYHRLSKFRLHDLISLSDVL
jgi:transposase